MSGVRGKTSREECHTDSGEKYVFDNRDFRREDDSEIRYWLEAMLAVKGRYDPGIIRYEGLDDLSRVIYDRNLNQAEAELLYRLFGQK